MKRMQSLKMHDKQAITAVPMLQERHRDIMHKLIRANAELQILQLDGKQVRTCSVFALLHTMLLSTCHYTQQTHSNYCTKT